LKKQTKKESTYELCLLMGKVNHAIILERQRELTKHNIPVQQTHVLRTIQDLGAKATLLELARQVEREPNVISRQTMRMENDGLIERVKNTPKSRILHLKLTEKGLALANMSRQSELISDIFSILSKEDCEQFQSILNRLLSQVEKITVQ